MILELSPGASAMLWWLLPALAPAIAWLVISRRSKANPNSDISSGIDELRRFQKAVAEPAPRDPKQDQE